jgi:glycerate 2-kinase
VTTVLFAPDSFKGSLTSVEVARALAAGWSMARPNDDLLHAPLGDGGAGTIYAVAYGGGWTWVRTGVSDPIRRQTEAAWLRSEDGTSAFIEMAEASGLTKLSADERAEWALSASADGTGELLCQALDAGVRHVILGIGGSATTDGGSGLLRALGARVDRNAPSVDLVGLDGRLATIDMEVACDVTNPLLGQDGAAAVYGPQKGLTPEQVATADGWLRQWADRLEAAAGRPARDMPGAGAAGGVGFALLAIEDRFRSFALRPGVELVMDATDFDAKLARADLVITGEGRIDAQTGFGKTALGVARRAAAAGVPCIAVGGGVEPEGIAALAEVGAIAVPVTERPQTIEDAIAAGIDPVVRCGTRIASLIDLVH